MKQTIILNNKNYFLINTIITDDMNEIMYNEMHNELINIGAIIQGTHIDRGFFHTTGTVYYYIPEDKIQEYNYIISKY